MTIAWTSFTPWLSLAGGLLIGVAAAMLILFNGRIAGISGIVGGLLRPARGDVDWRLAFVVGLLAAPLAWRAFAAAPALHVAASTPVLVAAGLLVGLGTRLGSGCTSGHGVCGMSRGALRSVAATATFMAAGFAVVFVVRHLLGG
ncbi:MAG: YeeE/YedE family protein [Burkholderiales bacterium]|nr:YeeE/YedE family protein [Burkholderiales bacterium]